MISFLFNHKLPAKLGLGSMHGLAAWGLAWGRFCDTISFLDRYGWINARVLSMGR